MNRTVSLGLGTFLVFICAGPAASQSSDEAAVTALRRITNETGIVMTTKVREAVAEAYIRGPQTTGRSSSSTQGTVESYYFDWAVSWLHRYPVIKLEVVPVPPRDYVVKINGESYPATDKSEYAVAPGQVALEVVRKGSAPCVWKANVSADQTVSCRLHQ